MTFDSDWIASVAEDLRNALRMRRIVFIHSSPIHGRYLDEIVGHLSAAGNITALGLLGITDEQVLDLASKHSVVLVHEVEAVKRSADRGALNQLRAKVQQLAQGGLDVCLISASSRETYPSVPGSSIVLDANSYALQPCSRKEGDRHGLSLIPAVFDVPTEDFRALYALTLLEVSTHALIELDRAIFELGLDGYAFPDELAPEVKDELRCAGILRREAGDLHLSFCVPARISNFRLALADALSRAVEAPKWLPDTSIDLFEIERLIRTKVREAAIARHGEKWRVQLVSEEVAAQIVENSVRDGQFMISNIQELRDPLEWLSLGQLLDLVTTEKVGTIGPAQSVWNRFRVEVVPIRNRVGHMRLISKNDQRIIRRWRMVLAHALT